MIWSPILHKSWTTVPSTVLVSNYFNTLDAILPASLYLSMTPGVYNVSSAYSSSLYIYILFI